MMLFSMVDKLELSLPNSGYDDDDHDGDGSNSNTINNKTVVIKQRCHKL